MSFYLGNYKANLYLGTELCKFLINATTIIPLNVLISSDNLYLVDKEGVYLVSSEE